MQKTITTSPNVSVLDSKIVADLCTGKFFIDLTPTQWIASGASNVLGARIKIVNPYGVAVKEFPLSGYDIVPPMAGIFQFNIPTEANNFQYGLYVVTVELTDVGGVKHEISDNINICQPNLKDKTKKYGIINAEILSDCKQGKVSIFIAEPPVYKSKIYESKTQSFVMNYPSESTLPSITSTANGFSVPLFEGEYVVKGDACVTYNFGDNNFIKVPYKLDCKKKVYCIIDKRCIYNKIEALNNQLEGCSGKEKQLATDIIFDALRLLKTIELGIEVGEDVSIYIEEIEKLLDCKCTCSVATDTPVSTPTLSSNLSITGCNVTKQIVGLTDVYTINNYEYLVAINPANNFITISAPTLTGCVQTQQLTFNVAALYTAIKGQITTQTEYDFWASVVNNSIGGLTDELLACLGITSSTWNNYTFKQKIVALITKMCSLAGGVNCNAVVSNFTITSVGADMRLDWDANAATYYVDVYVDGIFVATVIAPLKSYLLNGATFQQKHQYKLISRCSNGSIGNTLDFDYVFNGCPTILPPTLSSSNVANAICPYNLTFLSAADPAGFNIEWHNANNRLGSSLVPNPLMVTTGSYYAFMVDDVSNCASLSSKVIVTCAVAGNCTEPLGLLVEKGGSENIITFSSASTPPPSYLVKRKLATDPDVNASYTTIGSPIFNSGTNKWQILDTTYAANTAYTYKAESQCSDGSRPSAYYEFARISCATLSLVSTNIQISYSFVGTGGQINKYVVKLYDSTGTVLIASQIILPAFSNPIVGNFTGLSANTIYNVAVEHYINTFAQECNKQNVTTKQNNYSIEFVSGSVLNVPFTLEKGGVVFATGLVSSGVAVLGYSAAIPFGTSQVKLKIPSSYGLASATLNGTPNDTLNAAGEPDEAVFNAIAVPTFAAFVFQLTPL